MTSEAPNRPGQEPGEVPPGAGGPAPYGDRPAQQDNGYPGAPDLGWAPPPPSGRPAPAWAAQDDQPPAWAPSASQPVSGRATAQVPPPAEPGGRNAAPPAVWGNQEQSAPAWAGPAPTGEPTPPAWGGAPNPPAETNPPAWGAPAGPAAPAWAATPPQGEQPAWAQSPEPNVRGAAQVPAPATPPHESWTVPAGQQQDEAGPAGGWHPLAGQQEDAARPDAWPVAPGSQDDRSGGWAAGAAAQQPDEPNQPGGWGAARQEEQPAWAQQGDQPAAPWTATEPTARAAAKVSVPGADTSWPAQDEPARSGGWATGAPAQQNDGWGTGAQGDDPDRSGGWAAGRAAEQAPAWGGADEQRTGWNGTAPAPQQREQDQPPQPGWASAAVPAPGDQPGSGAWPPAEPPARSSAPVPSPDSPPAWGNQDAPAPWAPERPAIPDAEPWAPGEAWGRGAEGQPEQSPATGWNPAGAEEAPAYHPAPGPGISPANAMPLPPQEQRVPGAALAASPPSDFAPPAQLASEQADQGQQAYEPQQVGSAGGWASAEPPQEEPHSPAGPVVPSPRTSPEAGGTGHVSASASVPMASRVTPPDDQALPAAGVPAPQPRVYGRPTRPEPEEAPGPDAFAEPGPRFDEPSRRDEPEQRPMPPAGHASAPPVPSAPPSSPAGPPPFPLGVPSFADPAANPRPVNGVHPHNGEHPGGQPDPYAGGHQDPFGGPGGHPDPFGGPGGRAAVPVPGQATMGEPGQGGFPPAFPPAPHQAPPHQAPPAWQPSPDQNRFDAFKPDAEPNTEAPTPKVRNGRVLAAVLVTAVLILAVPLGLLALLGKLGGGEEKPAPFNPAVGACVKQAGAGAAEADCAEEGAYKVVSKVESKDKCTDQVQPSVELKGVEGPRWLCLAPPGQ